MINIYKKTTVTTLESLFAILGSNMSFSKKMIVYDHRQKEPKPFLLENNLTHPLLLGKTKKINLYRQFFLILTLYGQKLAVFASKISSYPQLFRNCGQNRSKYFNHFNTFYKIINYEKAGFYV